MSARIARDPSPFRSGLTHGALGAFTLTFVLAAGGGAMHVLGSPSAASPNVRMALFDEREGDAPQLNPRLPGYEQAIGIARVEPLPQPIEATESEPDLGVEYAGGVSVTATPTALRAVRPKGVRINGKTVMPGQTFSQISKTEQGSAAAATTAFMPATASAPSAIDPASPLARFSRPFENPEGKPTVSIIVGGLGTNRTRTRDAINELPPEVTLAFAPTADNLRGWVQEARRAGHEVLIELPMEPYDFGRGRPHPQVMQTGVSVDQNLKRLSTLLRRTSGYVGVMNHQGDKFATDADAIDPITQALSARGVAFFEDGRLIRSELQRSARDAGLAFGKATSLIDARPGADEISQQLLLLETTAREQGAALGTGQPFPVTYDILKEWLPTLESKGIALAPASHFAKQSLTSGQSADAGLNSQG